MFPQINLDESAKKNDEWKIRTVKSIAQMALGVYNDKAQDEFCYRFHYNDTCLLLILLSYTL